MNTMSVLEVINKIAPVLSVILVLAAAIGELILYRSRKKAIAQVRYKIISEGTWWDTVDLVSGNTDSATTKKWEEYERFEKQENKQTVFCYM